MEKLKNPYESIGGDEHILIELSRMQFYEIVRILINNGANVNIRSKYEIEIGFELIKDASVFDIAYKNLNND